MSTHSFTLGEQFTYHSSTYKVVRVLNDGERKICYEDLYTGDFTTELEDTLINAFYSGEVSFISLNRNGKSNLDGRKTPEEMMVSLEEYSERRVSEAKFRYKVIQPLLGVKRTKKMYQHRYQELVEEANIGHFKMSPHSIERWVAAFEKSGGSIMALVSNYQRCGNKHVSKLTPEMKSIVETIIENQLEAEHIPTLFGIQTVVAAEIEEQNKSRQESEKLSVPAISTIQRRLNSMDIRERYQKQFGKEKTDKLFRQSNQATLPDYPLEIVEFDHTKTDLIVVDDSDFLPLGRLTLSYAMDKLTKMPYGYYLGFEPPSYYTVMETLYHGICRKPNVRNIYGTEHDWISYGVPNTLVVDNGKELTSSHMENACLSLGIAINIAPVKTPEFKGSVERFFRTIDTSLLHHLPGTTLSNVVERREQLNGKDPCITLSNLERILNHYLVDEYAQRNHRGQSQGVPAQKWQRAIENGFIPRLPENRDILRIQLGMTFERTIQPYGIEFERITYNCPDLAYLRLSGKGTKVKFKLHPGDMSCIHVFDESSRQYIEVPALDQDYTTDLSLWKHRVIKNNANMLNDKEDLAALGRARLRIQEMVRESFQDKKTASRSKAKRWITGAKPKSISSTTVKSTVASCPKQEGNVVPTSPQKQLPTISRTVLPDIDLNSQDWGTYLS